MTTPTHDYGRVCLEDLAPLKDVLRNTPAQEDAHKEMVASLRAHGLLQPLVVRKEEECYRVIGGNRRFAALKELAAEGAIAPDAMVACTIEEIDDTEAVLAENTVRVAMHPADQAVAFAEIAGQGASEDDIGVRFGLSKRTVQRRLRLGRLAPEILEAYRVGEIETDIAQAYASTSNAERQLTVFKVLQAQSQHHGYYGGVNNVMQQLQKDSMRSDSPLAKFVGSKRYHDAGGQSEATLWDDYSVFSDIDLLQRLAKEKFERIAKRIAKDGWKWVEYSVDRDNQRTIRDKCTSLFPEPGQPTAAEAAIFDAAEKFDKKYADYEDDLPADAEAEHTRLSEQYAEALEAVHDRRSFTPEQMAASGVLLFFNRQGKTEKIEGLVKKGDPVPGRDDDAITTTTGSGTTGEAGADEKPQPKGYSQGLQESIIEFRTAVLRASVRENPELANDLLVFNLTLSLKAGWHGADDRGFYPTLPLGAHVERPLRLSVPGASEAMKGYVGDPEWKVPWVDPKRTIGEMFDAYRALSAEEKGQIAAQVASRLLLNAVGGANTAYDVHDAIAKETKLSFAPRLLDVDGQVWSVESYWGRLRKDQIIEEVGPLLGAEWVDAAGKMKKGELAEDACKRMKAHVGWLPKGFEEGSR